MKVINCKVADEYVQGAGVAVGAAGSHDDVALRLTFSPMWDGTSKKITWLDARGENPTLTVLTTNLRENGASNIYLVPVPAPPKAISGQMMMTICGVKVQNEIETSATVTATAYFTVLESRLDPDAEETQDITPTQAEQMQAEIEAQVQRIENMTASAVKGTNAGVNVTVGEASIALAFTLPKGDKGDTGAQGAKGDKGDTGAQGEKGDKGDKGDTGEQGAKGDKGEPGEPGAKGDAGIDGGYYTPSVDSAGNLSWSASKSDMPAAAGANIRGPQGEKGDKGDGFGYADMTPEQKEDLLGDTDAALDAIAELEQDYIDGAPLDVLKGEPGAKGDKGDKGDPGDSYILTAADKEEIAAEAAQNTYTKSEIDAMIGDVDTAIAALNAMIGGTT